MKRALILLVGVVLAACEKVDNASGPAGHELRSITTKSGVDMLVLRAGEFVMGDEGGNGDEQPIHRVKITKGGESNTEADWVAQAAGR